ncbi:hypothetical protein Q3G72_031698 [Acer saccharum]|nr:hypothetical protein Q3G72_031698 [Acer saccharum]
MEKGKQRRAVLVGCNYPNTKNELHGCINDVVAMKEVLIKRFGGHGTRIPSMKPGRPFKQDEAIVPTDFNLITDLDIRRLVNRLPKGTSFTILSDSCHSRGLINKEKEQIGPSSSSSIFQNCFSNPKTIPFQSIIEPLSSLTSINTSDIGTHLLEFLEPLKPRDEGILLSGCQANETSVDMNPVEGTGGKAYGAFSEAVQRVLKENSGTLSNRQVVLMARKVLEEKRFHQQPCHDNGEAKFLWQPTDYQTCYLLFMLMLN